MFITQSISNPVGVSVLGSHVLSCDPDRASISFAVVHIADRPQPAFEAVERSRAAVSAVLARHRLAGSDVSMSRVSLELAVDGYGKDRQVLGYRG